MSGGRGEWPAVMRNEGGSPAVEFALAAPLLFTLIIGIIELGTMMFVTVLLEGAIREASRYGITGQSPKDGDRLSQMRTIIADRTLGLVDVSQVTFTVSAYPSFDDLGKGEDFVDGNANSAYDTGETFKDCNKNGKWDSDRGTSSAGGAGDVVLYRLDYDWPLMSATMASLIGIDGKIRIQANTVVRNEPWDGASSGKETVDCNL